VRTGTAEREKGAPSHYSTFRALAREVFAPLGQKPAPLKRRGQKVKLFALRSRGSAAAPVACYMFLLLYINIGGWGPREPFFSPKKASFSAMAIRGVIFARKTTHLPPEKRNFSGVAIRGVVFARFARYLKLRPLWPPGLKARKAAEIKSR